MRHIFGIPYFIAKISAKIQSKTWDREPWISKSCLVRKKYRVKNPLRRSLKCGPKYYLPGSVGFQKGCKCTRLKFQKKFLMTGWWSFIQARDKHPCDVCGKAVSTRALLQRHYKTVHLQVLDSINH